MKTKNKLVLSLIFAVICIATGCPNSKTVVKKISKPVQPRTENQSSSSKPTKLNGVFYALPRTIIKVTVPVKKNVSTPARYSQFAAFFYPGEKFVSEQKTEFTTDKPVMESFGEPDPNEIYMIDIKSGILQTKTLFLEVSEDGLFSKAKAEVKDETPAFVGQVAKTAASIIGIPLSRNTVGGQAPDGNNTDAPKTACKFLLEGEKAFCESLSKEEREFFLGLSSDEKRVIYRSLDRRKSVKWSCYYKSLRKFYKFSDADDKEYLKKCEDINLDERSQAEIYRKIESSREVTKKDENTLSDDEKKLKQLVSDFDFAQVAVVDIQKLLDRRSEFIGGTNNSGLSADSFTAVLKEIDAQIKVLKNDYFLGTKSTASDNLGPFEIIPVKTTQSQVLNLFTYSKSKGILEIDNAFTGDGVVKKVKKGEFDSEMNRNQYSSLPDASTVSIEFKPNQRGSESQFSKIVEDNKFTEKGDRGFRYRIPANYVAFVKDGSKEISDAPFIIAQLGVTVSLPASTGSWRTSYELALYQNTGAMKNFTLGSDPLLQKSIIEDAEKAVTTLTNATDEAARLERQKKILELRQKIRELEEAAENPE